MITNIINIETAHLFVPLHRSVLQKQAEFPRQFLVTPISYLLYMFIKDFKKHFKVVLKGGFAHYSYQQIEFPPDLSVSYSEDL